VKDEKVKEKELIEAEHDDKYRKKYAGVRRVGRRL
jgi:hypothetical protein